MTTTHDLIDLVEKALAENEAYRAATLFELDPAAGNRLAQVYHHVMIRKILEPVLGSSRGTVADGSVH